MKCTDLCSCRTCSNVNTDEDAEATEEDDYENFDDDDWDDMIDEEDLLDNDDIWLGSEFLAKRNFLFILKSDLVLLQRYSCFI